MVWICCSESPSDHHHLTLNKRQRRSQLYKLIAAGCEVCDGNPPLLLDVLGHRLQFLSADVDELATVVNHPCEQSVSEKGGDPVNCFLGFQLEVGSQVFQFHYLPM